MADLVAVLPTAEEFDQAILEGKWRELSPLGYIGDPSVAAAETGEIYALEAADVARAIVALVGLTGVWEQGSTRGGWSSWTGIHWSTSPGATSRPIW